MNPSEDADEPQVIHLRTSWKASINLQTILVNQSEATHQTFTRHPQNSRQTSINLPEAILVEQHFELDQRPFQMSHVS